MNLIFDLQSALEAELFSPCFSIDEHEFAVDRQESNRF
jgi:hypothetical protein